MATRRDAREWLVQILFQLDLNPDEPEKVMAAFWVERHPDARARRFVEERVRGVNGNRERLDGLIRTYAENWGLERMGPVERSVMRMALYEMLFCLDVPPVVSINEAVDLARYFSSREAGRFVNGILDRARKDLNRPARTAAKGQAAPGGESAKEGHADGG